MNDLSTHQTTTVNPWTGDGYDTTTPMGRIERLRDFLKIPDHQKRLKAVLRGNAASYVASVLNEVMKSTAKDKGDVSKAHPASIMECIISSASLRLPIDGRQLAHIVVYSDRATLQIGYRGYLSRLGEALEGFVPVVRCVYKGDTFKSGQNGSQAYVEHTDHDPFGVDGNLKRDDDIIGAYALLSWCPPGGQRVSVLELMNKAEIDKVMSVAKDKSIWKAWYSEKAKVAIVRRASKIHFASVTNDLDEADNANFDMMQSELIALRKDNEGLQERMRDGLMAIQNAVGTSGRPVVQTMDAAPPPAA